MQLKDNLHLTALQPEALVLLLITWTQWDPIWNVWVIYIMQVNVIVLLIDQTLYIGDDPIMYREPELHDFMNEVASKIPTKWKQLGIQLRLDMSDIERIEAGLPFGMQQCDTAFIEVFERWKKVRPSAFVWGTLISTLEIPALNEKQLAHELYAKLSTA